MMKIDELINSSEFQSEVEKLRVQLNSTIKTKESEMDMVAAVQQHEIEELIEERENANVKLVLVAPSPDQLPEDGFSATL
ncbi:hypothetical protein ER16_Large1 [Pseudomonas phage ER16]|nr:hypothetical protein ER16_Large1 [Pseudomonas phage ER16]